MPFYIIVEKFQSQEWHNVIHEKISK